MLALWGLARGSGAETRAAVPALRGPLPERSEVRTRRDAPAAGTGDDGDASAAAGDASAAGAEEGTGPTVDTRRGR